MNLNKVLLFGNLTRDPEMRALPSGRSVVTLGLATNRMWKNKQGERQQSTEFHNVVLFGLLAEIAHQYLKKGSATLIEGRLQTRSWEGQDGVKRYRTEIVAEGMQLGPRSGASASTDQAPRQQEGSGQEEGNIETVQYPDDDINPDEIPF